VDWWNTAMLWALAFAAIAAIAVGIATWKVVTLSKQMGDAQDELTLNLRSKVATLEIAAGSTAKDLLGLQKAADDARAAQQRVEIDLAKQQERAANAERDAAEAKLVQDAEGFIAEMKAYSGQKFSCGVANDQEARAFLLELRMTLEISGWVPIAPQSDSPFVIDVMGTGDATGTGRAAIENGIGVDVVYAHNPSNESVRRARGLVSALDKHGIIAREGTSATIAQDTLNIFVGEKPGRWKRPKIPAKHQ
jgi:hypothetical protein